jgi:hypothetical protein
LLAEEENINKGAPTGFATEPELIRINALIEAVGLDILTEPVTINEPDTIALPVNGKVGVEGANEADNAWVAYDAVPCKLPVNDVADQLPVTAYEPDS